MNFNVDSLPGMKVTIMGLGLHGGGIESARFFARHGAEVTATDLRSEDILESSRERLADVPVRYVLGRHDENDFRDADLVIKNPAVRPDSPFLALARRVETDISVFLSLCPGPVLAVTGSKGKSSTASALHFVLSRAFPGARLGGNITTSPLTFLDDLGGGDPTVLELSSWQLGDLRGRRILKPRAAVITNILPDHLDRYGSMEPYVNDKRVIFENQDRGDLTVCFHDDPYGRSFARETPGKPVFFSGSPLPEGLEGAYLADGEGFATAGPAPVKIVPRGIRVIGDHQKLNLLAAGLCLYHYGLAPQSIREGLAAFPGIEHRLEPCGRSGGVLFCNDSAATIPEALTAAVRSFSVPLHLITGGTDKCLDFSVFAGAAALPKEIYLLEGSATVKLRELLDRTGRSYRGPYDSLEKAVRAAASAARDGEVVLLSPGCTSFGMFQNEFDRGRRYKALVSEIIAGR